jgi:hypothetical protein
MARKTSKNGNGNAVPQMSFKPVPPGKAKKPQPPKSYKN